MSTVKSFHDKLVELRTSSASAEAGTYFPTASDIVHGCSAYLGDPYRDIARWHEILLSRGGDDPRNVQVAALLDRFLLTRQAVDLRGLFVSVRDVMPDGADEILRAAVHETVVGGRTAEPWDHLAAVCTDGFLLPWFAGWRDGRGRWFGVRRLDADGQCECMYRGMMLTERETRDRMLVHSALLRAAEPGRLTSEERDWETMRQDMAWSPAAQAEPEVDEPVAPTVEDPDVIERRGVVVIAKPDGKETYDTRRMWDSMAAVSGVPLPLRRVGDLAPLRRLADAWPHAADLVATLVRNLVDDGPIRFPPTLIVGRPGTGKTSLLVAIAEALNIPSMLYPCSTSTDNAFGGTPSRWSSACPSTPLELIRQSGAPNPIVILDEIEKAPRGNRHGSIVDALLPMLEPHTASAYFEAAFNTTADLSHVSYLATANSLNLPAPIRDRFRVLRMPDPEPAHLSALCRRIVSAIAVERGQDGLMPPLAPDEEAVVARSWNGGSLRRLRRAVETAVDVRERLAVRQ